ncbi:MAG: arginase family protein [Ktedonobacterales bacterium]
MRADERGSENMPTMLVNADRRIRPFEVLRVVDYGDAAVGPFRIKRSMEPIRGLVRKSAETGAVLVALGGGHSILWRRGWFRSPSTNGWAGAQLRLQEVTPALFRRCCRSDVGRQKADQHYR